MQDAFIYIWRDKLRNMYYIGSHVGRITDSYLSSSDWMNGEIKYRPHDFRRRILKFTSAETVRLEEYAIIKKIKYEEFRSRYYNLRQGREKGIIPANKGKKHTEEARRKMSLAMRGTKRAYFPKPHSAENGRKSAAKVAATSTGRRMVVLETGERKWAYPDGDRWYIKKEGSKFYL